MTSLIRSSNGFFYYSDSRIKGMTAETPSFEEIAETRNQLISRISKGLTREEKLELDVVYVETRSLWFDLKIILATVCQVFGRKNIYEKRYSESERTRGHSDATD